MPVSIADVTSESTLSVSIDLFESDGVLDGGSPITLYEIQYDDGNKGSFDRVVY